MHITTRRAALAIALTAVATAPTTASLPADPLAREIAADASAAAPVAFERSGVIEQSSGAKRATVRLTQRYANGQWQLLAQDGRAPTDADRRAFEKSVAGLPAPGYYRLATFLSAGATAATMPDGRTVLRVARLPAGSVKAGGFDLSDRLSAEAVVERAGGRAYVSRVRIFLPAPTRIMMVAKLDRFEGVTDYTPGPGGTPVITRQTTEMQGYNPMQGDGQMRQDWTYRTL